MLEIHDGRPQANPTHNFWEGLLWTSNAIFTKKISARGFILLVSHLRILDENFSENSCAQKWPIKNWGFKMADKITVANLNHFYLKLIIPMYQILLTSLAPSAHLVWVYSYWILNVKMAPEMSTIFGIWGLNGLSILVKNRSFFMLDTMIPTVFMTHWYFWTKLINTSRLLRISRTF